MSENSERVKKWRKNTKKRIIKAMGGKCVCCGYSRCDEALELHHLQGNKKDFGFGSIRANPVSWEKIVKELRKCVLICCLCHRELHNGLRKLPEKVDYFDEKYSRYEEVRELHLCSVCGKRAYATNKTCSSKCAAKLSNGFDWDKIDLLTLIEKSSSYTEIGDKIGISACAVIKRSKKMGLPLPKKPLRPTKNELEKMMLIMSLSKIGKKYNVSQTAVRKWCKKFGLKNRYPVGYWAKVYAGKFSEPLSDE